MFKPLRLFPQRPNFDFIGKRKIALVLSTLVNLAAIVLVATVGLNFGIDFKGGIAIEMRAKSGAADLAEMRRVAGDLGLGEVTLQEFGAKENVLIRVQRQEAGAACLANANKVLAKTLGPGHQLRAAGDPRAGAIEVVAPTPLNDEKRAAIAQAVSLSETVVPRAAGTTARLEMGVDQKAEWCQQVAILLVQDALGANYEVRRKESVGPKVGGELVQTGVLAMGLTLLGIAAYVWFRFEWQFAVGALIALLHDVLTTFGLFVLLQLEFNLAALAAVLTIAGYSVNDTVVVFDRIRENMRKYKKMPLLELLNFSINETLARTVMTAGTVFIACLALVLFGGPVLQSFSMAMLWGVVVGTYSSIWMACAGLVYFNLRPDRIEARDDARKAAAAAQP